MVMMMMMRLKVKVIKMTSVCFILRSSNRTQHEEKLDLKRSKCG